MIISILGNAAAVVAIVTLCVLPPLIVLAVVGIYPWCKGRSK